MGNSLGKLFKITSFGESHGNAIGVVIDGCPAGLPIDKAFIQQELDRRRPGQSSITSARNEKDEVEVLSGLYQGISLGSPITLLIRNEDVKSEDYQHLEKTYRPSHADYTYEMKYGFRDPRGGGRSSARETAVRVAAGAIAKLLLKQASVEIKAYVSQVGSIKTVKSYQEMDLSMIEKTIIRCPDLAVASKMIAFIEEIRQNGDTAGGIITTVIKGVPAGWGEPVYDKLQATLAQAMLGINAVKGFEYGSGFQSAQMLGSEHNDIFTNQEGKIRTLTNFSGGIQGGISNGEDIYFRTAFKPVATLMKDQESVNQEGESIVLEGKGRHDPCVLPRAVPIVEAMAALVLADFYLLKRVSKVDLESLR